MALDPALAVLKPSLRGVLHQWAAPVALGAGIVLVAMAPDLRAGLACAVFATSLVTLFTVSATYHRVTWQPAARAWMRRADHASIFVLIAGTYTPIALLGLPAATGTKLSLLVWTGAALGVLQSLFWVHAPKWVVAVLAVAVGWSIVPYLGEVRHAVPGFV
jgi:hemolysin III